ncbi:MAG: hypothetical protein LBS62_05425 [Clostridiales bacterium]|jgi:hypothetical protein|nr:hypothetical protein [Clostridiales bacterium]
MILFGTNRHFDLTNIPFSRAGAFISIYENKEDGALYFTHCRSESVAIKRPNLMKLSFLDESGAEQPFTYYSDEARLTVKTPEGTAEFTYDGPQVMRARVTGLTLRFVYEPEMHEGADIRAADELEVGLNFMGKLLFKGITGKFATTAQWNFREVRPFPFVIDLASQAAGPGEMAIHEYYSSGLAFESYRPFEEAVSETLADFEEFQAAYPPVPEIYAETARRCAWVVWMHQMGPRGSLADTLLYMHKLLLVRGFGWHHSYAAVSMAWDARRAWRMLLTFFNFQDERGGIPDNVSDMNQENWVSTKPPLFGYAVCYILDNFDTGALTEKDYRTLYDKLARYRGWWFQHHDHAGTGFPSYYHVDESGYDESSLFNAGLPVQSPDLMAYMAVLDEALSKLAERLGRRDEALRWAAESNRTLEFLINELWDGEQFRSKVVRTGELYKCGSAAQIQPILLGRRLPRAIVEKIRDRVLDEEDFLTDYGITSESMKSPDFTMFSFTRGPVIAPVNFQIIFGLFDAGECEAARKIAIRYLNALQVYGPVLGTSSFRADPKFGRLKERYCENQIGAPLAAWGASVFLAVAARLR